MDGRQYENETDNPTQQPGETDFYVVLEFKRARGTRILRLEDAEGDTEPCLVLPLLKNGIISWGKTAGRLILAARKSHRDDLASHVLVPQVPDKVQKAMVAADFFNRYKYTAPIIGEIIPDITQIYDAPIFSENSSSHTEAQRLKNQNIEAKTLQSAIQQATQPDPRKQQKLSRAQQRIREMILKRKNTDNE